MPRPRSPLFNAEELNLLASAWCRATGDSLPLLGIKAAANRTVFVRLAAGAGVNLKTAERVSKWLAVNFEARRIRWPAGVDAR